MYDNYIITNIQDKIYIVYILLISLHTFLLVLRVTRLSDLLALYSTSIL